MSDKNSSFEKEALIVINIVSERCKDHGNISDRPLEYIGAGVIVKAERVKKVAINIVAQAAQPPKAHFLSEADKDGLRDMVAYCLEALRRDSELRASEMPF